MTGFIRGIFGSKQKENVEPQQNSTPQRNGKAEAYYLSSDDAKTYGNIEFMRQAKQTRRTFPKAKFGTDNAFVHSLSSIEKAKETSTFITPSAEAKADPNQAEANDRRRTDTSMDMFRNMAREIRKR